MFVWAEALAPVIYEPNWGTTSFPHETPIIPMIKRNVVTFQNITPLV
jgi:hypothetical protein